MFAFYTGKGELDKKSAGRYTSLSREAGKLHVGQPAPKIVIETTKANVLIKSYDAVTVVVKSKST